MSKELMQVFNFNESQVRTVIENGEILFVASDIAKLLGYSNPSKAISDHCKGVTNRSTLTNGGMQILNVIPESDLYRLTFRSNLPTAEKFTEWVASEVLPSIRKTGHYATRKTVRPEIEATTIFKSYHSIAKLIGLDKNQSALAANNAAKSITGMDTLLIMGASHLLADVQEVCFTPTELGKQLSISASAMNNKIRAAGLQNNVNGKWCMTEKGKAYGRLFDTGKKNGGTPVMQLKWYDSVLAKLQEAAPCS